MTARAYSCLCVLHNILLITWSRRSFGNNDREDFRIVSGILRLSTKYMIDSLRAKALAHLSVAWPCTLKGWDAREDLARTYEVESITGNLYPSPIVSNQLIYIS